MRNLFDINTISCKIIVSKLRFYPAGSITFSSLLLATRVSSSINAETCIDRSVKNLYYILFLAVKMLKHALTVV